MKKLGFLLVLVLTLQSCVEDDQMVVQCGSAFNQSESDISINNVTLQWQDANSATTFNIEYGPSGFLLGTGIIKITNQTSIILVDLTANTTYDYYIETVCSTSNVSLLTAVRSFTTLPELVVPNLGETLSGLNLYSGELQNLEPSIYAFEYELSSPSFSDYARKQRLIALPPNTFMDYVDDGFPIFPDNTVISKTFYYNIDDRDESLGKKIIETRVLLKSNGEWILGNYIWNDAQTEAIKDLDGATLPVTWIDDEGITNNINYQIPSNTDCFTCHSNSGDETPIGPKLRSMNFEVNGMNQLQSLKDLGLLLGVADVNSISTLPNYDDDTNYTLEERARAYFDINCAHCHIDGGFCELQSPLRLSYETPFADSEIFDRRPSIINRITTYNAGFSMPLIGTTVLHDEGVALIIEYLNSL